MSAAHDPLERLLRLNQILSEQSVDGRSAGIEPAHAREARAQQIRQLTVELQHDGIDCDEVDVVTMRLLLNDYVTSLSAFRAMAREAEAHLSAVPGPLKEVRRALNRYEKLKLKREAQSAG